MNVSDWLDHWEAPYVQIPNRSRLYHLEPIGIGTSDVECFTSYLARLAATHHVTVLSLVKKEIIPWLPTGAYGHNTHRSILYGPYARALNGLERMAKYWVAALEGLTLRTDLSLLTMSRWCEVLPPVGMIRPERAWCPSCYQQWRAEDKTVFDPLLWSIRPVEICIHHKRALANHCPHCGQTLPFLTSHYKAGYCSRCMKWLGSSFDDTASVSRLYKKDKIEWQQWLSNNVGELLAVPLGCPSPDKERVGRTLKAFSRNAPRQSINGFAKWLRMPNGNVTSWCSGRFIPRLSSLLYICYRLDITLVEFLLKDDVVKELNKDLSPTGPKYKKRKICPRDKESIRRNMEDVLASEELPPSSLLTVSKQLEIDAFDLRKMFPELCKRISEKHKQHRNACCLMKLKSICEDIKRISLELHNEGIEPTRGRISARMNKSGYFRRKEVKQALTVIRQELGYEAC